MARARNIKPSFFANDDLADITPIGRLLFIGLWTLCDREGRLEDRPRRIKAETLPYDDCDVDELLQSLHDNGFVLRYESEGKKCIQVVNFIKHQDPHYKEKASTLPAPSDIYDEDAPQIPCHQAGLEKNNKQVKAEIESSSTKLEPTLINDRPMIGSSSLGQSPLIPDSPFLIPDPPFLNPDSVKRPLSVSTDLAVQKPADDVAVIFAYWQKRMDSPRAKLDDKRRKKIKAGLAMGYTPAELCQAIRGCSLTPHNMGENDRGQKYNGIDLIFRSADQIDRFIANNAEPPGPPSGDTTKKTADAINAEAKKLLFGSEPEGEIVDV